VAAFEREKVLEAAQKLVEKKRFDKAILEYQKVLAKDPRDVRTLLKVGDLHLKLSQHVEAVTTYEQVGEYYASQGFALKAIAVYKQIREIIQKHVPHLEDRYGHIVPRLAELYKQLGLTSDAQAAYDEVATRLQRAGRDRDAIDVFKKVVELDRSNPLPYLRLGEAFLRVKDYDSAMDRFAQGGEILLKLGRKDDAIKVVERVLQYRPDAKFARLAAQMYLERNAANDAMAALTKLHIAFKENPKDLDTLTLLARAFDQLGQPSKAVEVLKEAARHARDAGNDELFQKLATDLRARAPDDEGVRALLRPKDAPSTPAPPKVEKPEKPEKPERPEAPAARAATAPRVTPEARPAPGPQAAPTAARNEREAARRGPESVRRGDDQAPASIEIDVVEADELELEAESAPVPLRPTPAARPSAPRVGAPPITPAKPAPRAPDPVSRAKQYLNQADQLRSQRRYDQAATVLARAVVEFPDAREHRERLIDVLIEDGQQDRAIAEMIAWARHLVHRGQRDEAAQRLDEVLLLDAQQSEARALLAELGYSVPEPQQAASRRESFAAAPLPSYDLEEMGAADVLPPGPSPSLDDPFEESQLPAFPIDDEKTTFIQTVSLDELDDVGAQRAPRPAPSYAQQPHPQDAGRGGYEQGGYGQGYPAHREAPHQEAAQAYAQPPQAHPSGQGYPQTGAYQEYQEYQEPYQGHQGQYQGQQHQQAYQEPYQEPYQEQAYEAPAQGYPEQPYPQAQGQGYAQHGYQDQPYAQQSAVQPVPPAPASRSASLDEDALEEMEFFTSHGMYDEARAIIDEQLSNLPNHPLLLLRKQELEGLIQERDASGTRAVPRQAPAEAFPAEDRSFDIAASLDALDSLDAVEAPQPAEDATQQISVESVFEQFKAGVAQTISESDASTHYDLGVAYREMGLLADAIHEFELAGRDPSRECVCQSMVGMIHLQMGDVDRAIDAWIKGLHAAEKTREQELALLYELGNAYESRSATDQALYYFQRTAQLEPGYRDPRGAVGDRIRRLQPAPVAKPAAKAVGSELDDFDQAFDDLFNGTKLP
jgi:lipopolysaccharide biosynthesis regulator YciM